MSRFHCFLVMSLLLLCPGLARSQSKSGKPTVTQAQQFMNKAEKDLLDLGIKASRASWVASHFITDDTEQLSAAAQESYSVAVQRYAIDAKRFDTVTLPDTLRRKFMLLKLALAAPPPGNPSEAAELTRLAVGLEADYGKGTYCRKVPNAQDECR